MKKIEAVEMDAMRRSPQNIPEGMNQKWSHKKELMGIEGKIDENN